MVAFSKAVDQAIKLASEDTGLGLRFLKTICYIESSGNPKTGNAKYKGLFALSAEGFRKHGGRGSIFDPVQNARAGARKINEDRKSFLRRAGREPTDAELYLIHQQGVSGGLAHIQHPEREAWKSMNSTTEGKKRGPAWSKRAIWQNLTAQARTRFKKVENVSSQDFIDFWKERFEKVWGKIT